MAPIAGLRVEPPPLNVWRYWSKIQTVNAFEVLNIARVERKVMSKGGSSDECIKCAGLSFSP